MKDAKATNELGLPHPSSFILHPSSLAVLPLPLAAFERFQWLDDRPAYPMVFYLQLTFQGRLDREAFSQALMVARQRQPLLCALVAGTEPNLIWQAAPQLPVPLYWEERSVYDSFPFGPRILLREEVGLRVLVRESAAGCRPSADGRLPAALTHQSTGPIDELPCEPKTDNPEPTADSRQPIADYRTDLFWQFHHACCDGLGAMVFVEDVLVEYASRLGQTGLKQRLWQAELLRQRSHFHLPPLSWREQLRDIWVGLRLGVNKMLRQAEPLAAPATTGQESCQNPDSGLAPSFLLATLPAPEVQTLRQAAARFDATLNDLLLCALFGVVEAWNADKGSGRGPIRLMMPTNLRLPEDASLPAANVMACTFLDRSPAACRQIASLLASIRAETAAIKRWRLGLYFIGVLDFGLRWPRLINYLLGGLRCFASLYLTNLSDPTRHFLAEFPQEDGRCQVGNLALEDIAVFPPLRPRTPAAFSAVTYRGLLRLGLHFDPGFFAPSQAQELLDLFTQHLRRLPELLIQR